jgi:hypothetical protein
MTDMRMRKLAVLAMAKGLAGLVLVLFLIGCGSSGGSSDSSANNDPGNLTPIDTHDDYAFVEPAVSGSTFYIDPQTGSDDGDGSEQHPWRTLQQVIESGKIECYRPSENYDPDSELEVVNEGAPVRGGDRLLLRSGYHGHVALNTFVFNDWLTIAADSGHTPVLAQFKLEGAFARIYLKGLTIRKDSYVGEGNYWEADTINHNSDACLYLASSSFWGNGGLVKVNGLTLGTTADASGWNDLDWQARSAAGIGLRSVTHCEVVNCRMENVSFGLSIEYASDYTIAVNNRIKYYSGDGVRLISNNVFLAYNTITDCLDINDGNHDDAIQSYSRGADNSPGTGVLYNNVVRGNLIIGTTDFSHPLAGNPQGIGCFDGFFDGWIVENNVVIVDHYHGISFYGMRNSHILNNTVIDQNHDNDISPWIMITDHKDGTPSQNCVVANNIAYRSLSVEGNNVAERNNYIIGRDNAAQLTDLFLDPDTFDFHLITSDLTTDNIIDKGEAFAEMVSSELDVENQPRAGAPDLGAYELE